MLWQSSESLLGILAQIGKNAGGTRFSHLMLGSSLAGLLMACTAQVSAVMQAGSAPGAAAAFLAAGTGALGLLFIWLLRLPFFPFSALTGAAALWTRRLGPASLAYSWLVILLGNSAGALAGVLLVSWGGFVLEQHCPGVSPSLSPAALAIVMEAGRSLSLGFGSHFVRGLLFGFMISWALIFYINPPRLISRAGLFLGAAWLAAGGGFEQVAELMYRVPMGLQIAASQASLLSETMSGGLRVFPMNSAEISSFFNSINFVSGVFIPVLLGNISGGALLAALLGLMSRQLPGREG